MTIDTRFIIIMLLLLAPLSAAAQDYVVRYVSVAGDFSNDGTSWANAKNNLQNAIDEVYEEVRGTSKQGYIFVAGSEEGMTYVPTRRSSDDADGSVFNTSFRIYAGIHVYGGFAGTEVPDDPAHPELLPLQRLMTNGHTYERVSSDIDADNIGETVRRWNFRYKTILSGNHSANSFMFRFDTNRGIYSTTFPLSSYHVVWFATNGKIEPGEESTEKDLVGHYKGLDRAATLDGCTIEGGYASTTSLKGHEHTSYGGGVYMVRNAFLRNCIVSHCAATQRGGAVYLDGGGEVDRCYIHTSQATGYGMQQGNGGGVCIDYDGAVRHTYIVQCAARIGAGLAICHVPREYPEVTAAAQDPTFVEQFRNDPGGIASPYDPFANATVIANCTSNAEGGGVYLDEGGTLNHCTVVNNKCVGPDVIYYGRRHARTGGIYVRNRGTLYNTVAWGNSSPVNNDVQFASFKDAEAEANDWRIAVYHCAFSKSDITDWATATKENVVSLTNENTPEHKEDAGNFPIFSQPTYNVDANGDFILTNNQKTLAVGIQYDADGNVHPEWNAPGQPYQRVYNWHPLAASTLRQKGVQVNEALQGITEEVMHARTETDIIGRRFEAISCIGALAQSYRTISFDTETHPSLEATDNGALIPTLYVDPNRKAYGPENDKEYDADGNLVDSPEPHAGYLDNIVTGESWEHPIGNLGNAIRTLKRRQWTTGEKKDWFNIGGTKVVDGDGNVTFTGGQDYEHAQICVKEGSLTTAGPDCYLGTQARTASIRPVSNLRIYGSFPRTNTGTDISGRSQRKNPTKVSANVLNSTFMNNGAHVFALINVHDVIIDGFRLYNGNANINEEGSYSSEPIMYGGGLIINNTSRPVEERQDMTGNILRNCVIANCAAPEGAAIYVNGNNLKSDGTHCKAELTVINTIIRNNTAGDMHGDHEWYMHKPEVDHLGYDDTNEIPGRNHRTTSAVVTANGNAHVWLRNCDIVNNCGYALKARNHKWPDEGDRFQIEIYNSILFSNGREILNDRGDIRFPVSTYVEEEDESGVTPLVTVVGNYLYIDHDSPKPAYLIDGMKLFNYLTRSRQDDGKANSYYTPDTDAPEIATLHYPYFVNPSRNVGHSEGDRPLYGGSISYEPLNLNPIVNGAYPETDTQDFLAVVNDESTVYTANCKAMSYDADLTARNYGGAPDAGAVEDTRLPRGGAVIYVTPDGAGKRDGSSWANAIAGNTVYMLDNVAGPALAAGDQLDPEATCDRILDSDGNPVLTTDEKYCGGFGRVWMNSRQVTTTTTTEYKDYVTEKIVYVGGENDGTEETIKSNEYEESTVTETTSSVPAGFTPGYYYDPRYPYGEISGQSRTFWRANPYTGSYGSKDAFVAAENEYGFISNTRAERYVGGLQYAVEQAAAYNALAASDAGRIDGVDSVMVWVGNGKYTDYKGFIMRDNTTIMGSFPVSKGGTPGLSERQALMSDVVRIPKSLPAQNLKASDYESILQISDTNPNQDHLNINTEAVKFWDDDLDVQEITTTERETTCDRLITRTYTWTGTTSEEDKTNDFFLYSTFEDNSITSETTVGANHILTFGTATDTKDCWHLTYTGDASTTGSNGVIGRYENNQMYGSSGVNIYENGVYKGKTTEARLWIRNGSLTGLNLWQDMKNVPAGNYKMKVDLNAFYRDGTTQIPNNVPTGVKFIVRDSKGNTVVEETISAKGKGNKGGNLGRTDLCRYTFTFTQPANGTLSVRIEVGDFDSSKGNNREVEMANLKLFWIRPAGYYETAATDVRTKKEGTEDVVTVTNSSSSTVVTHRTTLRKRVLTMPDVCVPTYGGGGIGNPVTHATSFNDQLPHSDRVTGSAKDQRTATPYAKQEDPFYVSYSDVCWDGFTIRHGFLYDEAMTHGGGAGVNIYEGAHLRNCIIIDNFAAGQRMKGGGIFCDGATSTIEGCFVLNNTSTRGTTDVANEYKQVFAGGMFMYEGTCFNSLFAKNHSFGSAGGVGFCVGRFFNNTIAYNTCDLVEGGHVNGGAVSIATQSNPNLFVANTIIYGNSGMAIRERYDQSIGIDAVNPFIHCYIQTEVAFTQDLYKKNIGNHSDNSSYYGIGNVLLSGSPSASTTPFAADIAGGSYDEANPGAKATNDFRLTNDLADCINKGTEDFAGTFFQALRNKGKKENEIKNSFIYKTVYAAELPENDVAFAQRVQDCQIDMGAYEFDGAKFIEPDLSEDGKAIFYVSETGGQGLATASTPEDAACKMKLQKVLDAAGRWKYASNFYMNTVPGGEHYNMTNFTRSILKDEITTGARKKGVIAANESLTEGQMAEWLAGLKERTVIVKLAGDYYRDASGNFIPDFFKYTPTRSTVTDETLEENVLEYSLMVPRGVQVIGGYTEDEVTYNGQTYPPFSDVTRDALGNHTKLSGEVTSSLSGSSGNAFHVVTFVEDLFDIDERLYRDADNQQITGQLHAFTDEKDRAVLDGLYISDGYANGTDAKDRRGAGAVVTGYAHIRNCIVQYNEATGEGGGLYLEPHALVSGSIIKENTAYTGGGIYVEEPDVVSDATYARVITSTVVNNTAQTVAGGMHFETNVRANSSAFWKNTANDLSNVAGTFTNSGVTQVEENCPFNYCGVESRRISGVNNIELPVAEDEGVRWNHIEPHEVMRWNVYPVNRAVSTARSDSIYYFPINLSSVLGRAGMTYAAYEALSQQFPTMEVYDIGGLKRTAQTEEGQWVRLADGTIIDKELKNNAFIEMGARVLNGSFELHVEYSHVMTRLFVTTTQLLPTEDALALQQNPDDDDDAEMYRQMGSSFLNPFHRLGDALEYIVRVRSSDERTVPGDASSITVGDKYKNERFEVFVTSGTFYPFRDAHGNQGEARANTFVVPEEVTIVGGCNRESSGHNYCQENTTGDIIVAGRTLNGASTEKIRADRQRLDRNGNHVKEPWEMQEQTILSGNAVSNTGSTTTNVYHVITCFPDEGRVGKLPSRWEDKAKVAAFDGGNADMANIANTLDPLFDDELPDKGAQAVLLENIERECRESKDRRTIFIDGVTITGGHANDIEDEHQVDNFQKLTYFRGGGILVEGNWDNSFDDKADLPEVLGVAKRDIALVTTNCLFQDNTGGNGGAVYTNGTYYSFGCHYTKNTACGPNTSADQRYIPWTAGGAIANNYQVHLWNCLFDNNEAMRGKMAILEEMTTVDEDGETVSFKNPVSNADARQGYGGAISCSETGLVRVGNCDFVRNKAVAFPAIYNFIDNNLRAYSGQVYDDYYNFLSEHPDFDTSATYGYNDPADPVKSLGSVDGVMHNYAYFKEEFDNYYYGKGHHFAVNSIFWGNEATSEIMNAFNWQEYGFYNWRESTPKYSVINDSEKQDYWTDSRRPNHVANFGPLLDIATLTFCALEEGTGREGTVWQDNHDRAKSAQITAKGDKDGLTRLYEGDFLDVLYNDFGFYPAGEPERPIYKKTDNGDGTYTIEPCAPSASAWILDADGKTERHPTDEEVASAIAYNYNLVLDPENLDPNGPYFVQPSLAAGEDGYMETADWLVARLNRTIDTGWGMLKQKVEQASETSGLFKTTLLDKDKEPVDESTNQYEELWGEGFYNLHSKNIYDRFKDIGFPNLLPIGDAPYMDYTTEGTNETSNMRRISTHPKMGVQDVFIDMGIYEYQYVQLITGGDQVDVIWVAETEDRSQAPCNGSTWAKATSDLQGAIETLLLSRNDHDKVIKMRAGTYSPINMTEGNQRAFYISVPSRNTGVVLPAGVVTSDDNFAVRSLTIRGGYSNSYTEDSSDGEETRNSEENPTVLQMVSEVGSTDHQMEHLFIIEDAEMKSTYINYLNTDNKDFEDHVMTVSFEGLTFCNPYGNYHHEDGGAAILYEEQYRTVDRGADSFEKDKNQLLRPGKDAGGNPVPKLIIKDCVFAANGKDNRTSAVKVGKGGGETLIVNSLFHSNSAAPIDAVNTKLINCTFALNGGHITLRDETETYGNGETATFPSQLHNSIVWRDDLNNAATGKLCGPTQWDIKDATGADIVLGTSERFTHNAYTQADTEPDGTTTDDATTKHNFLLSKENGNVLLGPNFTEPYTDIPDGATDLEQLAIKFYMRDFHIGPSAHILNHADAVTYRTHVPCFKETATQEQKELRTEGEGGAIVSTYYWFHSVQHDNPAPMTEAMLRGTDAEYAERELAYKHRWLNNGIERGAYECTAVVERVLYVMDGVTGNQDGTSWENAFDIADVQKAIDVASVYSLTSSPQERAYVFVKASDSPVDALRLRDGVSVFGSVNTSAEVVKDGEIYRDEDIDAYIHQMRAARPGIATRDVTHNTIRGLVSDNDAAHAAGFLLDGFWINAGETATTPVQLTKNNTVVRNVVITGNTVTTAGLPVIDLAGGPAENSLLYNTLVYGNTPGSGAPVVSVGTRGYALNNTIVATNGHTALTASDGHAQNNIALNAATATTFAPYFNTAALPYTPPTDYEPYHYQLHEYSEHINPAAAVPGTGIDDGTTAKSGGNTIALLFPDYVNFDFDRDVLGNPRRLGARVDNGAFETWRIGTPALGADPAVPANVFADNTTNYSYTSNYGGHRYPHAGSVVYVCAGSNLVFATDGVTPLFNTTNPVRPGYVYVQEGASVYGQGNTLQFPYVAADKSFAAREQRRLMAFPFDVSTAATMTVTPGADGQLTLAGKGSAFTPYSYDAVGRSAYGYQYKADNSPLWKTDIAALLNADGQVARTKGWLMELGSEPDVAQTLRFTGWGSGTAVAYDEDGADKVVTLDQHNANTVAATTHYPRFTQMENMGWNLKGQPWLVSHFRTDASSADGTYLGDASTAYRMNVPHVIYQNLDNTLAAINAMPDGNPKGTPAEQAVASAKAAAVRYGQFYTAQSWGSGTDIALGDGFFTQTAIIATVDNDGRELLTFRRPEYAGTPVAPVKDDLLTVDLWSRSDTTAVWADAVQLCARADADADMPYRLNSDGVKWLALDPAAPQLWLENEGGTAFSLAAHAPLATLLPLTVRTTPEATITFALRPGAAAADSLQAVWLIDREQNRMVNLLDESYTTGIGTVGEAAAQTSGTTADVAGRFFLQLGGMAQMPEAPATTHAYRVYVRDRVLHILGTNPGDRIRVHTPAGALVLTAEAANDHFHTPLRQEGVYLVTIERETHKIIVR